MYGTEKLAHLGGYLNIQNDSGDPGTWGAEIWNKMINDFSMKSVLDIGCGLGYSCRYFHSRGLKVVGVEGGDNAIKNSVFTGKIIKNDYTISSANISEKFDLIWCCEFVEHVEEKYASNFLNDFKVGSNVAMTFADKGQPGYHHVNCQPEEYWVKLLNNLGFDLDSAYTDNLRNIAASLNNGNPPHSGHLTRILFFKRHL